MLEVPDAIKVSSDGCFADGSNLEEACALPGRDDLIGACDLPVECDLLERCDLQEFGSLTVLCGFGLPEPTEPNAVAVSSAIGLAVC